MTDPLILEYLPSLRGHVIRKYGWMTERGNCLLTLDDIIQIASITLVRFLPLWDDFLAREGKSREGNGGLFWTFLEKRVRDDVLKYYERQAHGHRGADASADDVNENPDAYTEPVRTALTARTASESWGVVHEELVDFFATLPRRDKMMLALRYFDDLPTDTAADLFGIARGTFTVMTSKAVRRWRSHARNQYAEYPGEVPARVEYEWAPSDALSAYLRDRHRKDIDEYLGYVTICLRADSGYLGTILDTTRHNSSTAEHWRGRMTADQEAETDRLLCEGVSAAEISRRLDIPVSRIRWHKTKRAA